MLCWIIGTGVYHLAIITTLVGIDLDLCHILASHLKSIQCHGAVVEAQDQHEMTLTSAQDIYKMLENIHMLCWIIGTGIHHHAIITTLNGIDLDFGQIFTPGHHTISWCSG